MDNPVIFLLLAIIVIGAGIIVAMNFMRRSGSGMNQDEFRSRWMKIDATLSKENDASWQVALFEADKLLDQALIAYGARGNTLGERLKSSGKSFGNINAVWGAHKLRNQLAHDPNARLNYGTTLKALGVFKQALKDLGAI